jgi:hypothetical protein
MTSSASWFAPPWRPDQNRTASDDRERTWYNNAGTKIGTSGSSYITSASPGVKVWTIGQDRGLMNQESQVVALIDHPQLSAGNGLTIFIPEYGGSTIDIQDWAVS